jgi:GNAT superfamily N-acetyltransferase
VNPEVSGDGWARTLRAITVDEQYQDYIYIAVDEGGELVGLAMDGLSNAEALPQTGAVYVFYVSTNHQGLGRRLVQAVAAELAQKGMTTLQIGCLAANAPARGFYEAITGRLVGERMFDEESITLAKVVYEWADIEISQQLDNLSQRKGLQHDHLSRCD